MRIVLIAAALAAAACGSKGEAPTASGSLVFESPAAGTSDVFLATEAEVLKSQPIRDRMKQQLRLEAAVAADAIVATPKAGTLILEVGVNDPDPRRAAELCNALIRTYVDYRVERALIPLLEEEKALAEQLERHPEDVKLRERMKELDLARRVPKRDVRVLDGCRATASRP